MPRRWQRYDPSRLIELAKEYLPEERWLPAALAKCTRCRVESAAYIYFVDPSRPNIPGSEWQHETNLSFDSPVEGLVVLDVLKDGRIGGVEFVDRIEA